MQAAEIGEFQKEPTLRGMWAAFSNSSSAAALHPQSERARPGNKHILLTPSLPFLLSSPREMTQQFWVEVTGFSAPSERIPLLLPTPCIFLLHFGQRK